VDDAALVSFFERGRDVAGNRHSLPFGERSRGNSPGEGRPGHVLHDEEIGVLGAVEVVHRGDMCVVEARQRLGLAAEPSSRHVVQRPRVQHLDRHIAIEMRIAPAVHLAHPTGAEALDDAVVRESAADHFGGRGSETRWNRPSMAVGLPCEEML
jgi:hypothetical protein